MTFAPIGHAATGIVDTLRRSRIETHEPATREEWLKLREATIGASEVAALFGAHPFLTAFGLWAVKSGKITAEEGETPAMRRGRFLEEVAVRFLKEERPTWQVTPNTIPGGQFYRCGLRRLSCTPDAFAVDPERPGFGVVQIKSVEPGVFRKKWRNDEGEVEPPLWIAIQAIQEAHLTGASWAVVAPLVVGFGLDMPLLEVPLHAGLIDAIELKAREFWQKLDARTFPEPDWMRDAALAAQLITPMGAVRLDGDNALPGLLAEREQLKAWIKGHEKRCDEIEAEIKSKIGVAERATLPGWSLTFKTVETRPYSVARRVTRPLKIHRVEERETA